MDEINVQNDEFWRQLEMLSLKYISSKIKSEIPKEAELTRERKDGGFDGKIVIDITEDSQIHHRILFESKFRTTIKTLPLTDCSKALIIAFNQAAQTLFLVTNILFSEQAKQEIQTFKKKVNLNVIEVDGQELKRYVETNRVCLEEICSKEFLQYIVHVSNDSLNLEVKSPEKKHIQKRKRMVPKESVYKNFSFIDNQQQAISVLKNSGSFILLNGNAGIGKTIFLTELLVSLGDEGYSTAIFNLQQYQTPRILFTKLLESLWDIDLSEYLVKNAQQDFRYLIEYTADGEIEEALSTAVIQALYANSKEMKGYADNYYYLLSKYLLQLLKPYQKTNKIIWAFTDLNKANIETLDFLYSLLSQIQGLISIIVEIRPYFTIETTFPELVKDDYYKKFTTISARPYSINLKEFDNNDAKEYLKQYLKEMPDKQLQSIVDKTGTIPLYLNTVAIYLKSQIVGRKLKLNAIPDYVLDSFLQTYQDHENSIIFKSLEYYSKDFQVSLCFAITGLLDGVLPTSLIETIYDFEQRNILYEKLDQISYYTFNKGNYQVKHDFIFDAMRSMIPPRVRYYAAKNIKDYSEKVTAMPLSLGKKFEILYELNEYEEALTLWEILVKELYYQHEFFSIIKYGDIAIKCYDNLELPNKAPYQQINIITSILDAYIQIRILNTEHFNDLINRFETICNLQKYSKYGRILKAKLLFYKWNKFFYGAEIEESYKVIEEAKQIIEEIDSDDTDNLSGNIHWAYALSHKRKSSLAQAIIDYENSLKKYPQSAILKIGLYLHKAHAYLRKQPVVAQKICQNLLEDVRNKDCPFHEILQIRIDIVMAGFYSKQYERALDDCKETLQIARSVNAAYQIGRLYNIYAACLLMFNNEKEALDYFTKARYEFQESGNILFEWRATFNLAQLLLRTGQTKDGLKFFQQLFNNGIPNLNERIAELSLENSEMAAFLYTVRILKKNGQYKENELTNMLNKNNEFTTMEQMEEDSFKQLLNSLSYLHDNYLIILG